MIYRGGGSGGNNNNDDKSPAPIEEPKSESGGSSTENVPGISGEGKGESVTTNKGNKIDVTPSQNHSTTHDNPVRGQAPNSSIDILDENGDIKTRRWFDENGNAIRDVDYTNHGNPSTHPEWPHEHIWNWDQNPPRQ